MCRFMVCVLLMCMTTTAYAAPCGNPAAAAIPKKGLVIKDENSRFSFNICPEFDYIRDRYLKNQQKRDNTEYKFFGGKTGISIWDKFFAYGFLGAGNAEYKMKVNSSDVTWKTDYDLSWGAGASTVLYEKQVTVGEKAIMRIGVDGKYRASDLGVDKVTLNGLTYDSSNAALSEKKFNLCEWQVSAGLSYEFERIIPYVGAKYSDVGGDAKATISGTNYKIDFSTKNNFGVFFGTDVLFTDSISAYVEGRLIDEKAISAGGTIRF